MASVPTTPLFAEPRRLLLEMAREHALPDLLRLVVDRLAESPRVALARIWLMRRSEDCDGCVVPAECRDRSACLHLVASAGRSALDPKVECGGAARAVRERVLRPRPRRLHRRAARPGRAVRAGRRRHVVPRRGGRDPPG